MLGLGLGLVGLGLGFFGLGSWSAVCRDTGYGNTKINPRRVSLSMAAGPGLTLTHPQKTLRL